MAKWAWVFPGQGSQFVGMGRDLVEVYPVAGETFERANSVLGFDLASICFEGPEEELRQTRYTQPAILVHSVAVLRILENGAARPAFVDGHSVGEYSALVANGALAFEDALRLVRIRAEAMYASGLERPGGMAAIMGMPEVNLEPLLAEARRSGMVEPANYNSPVQIVLSGEVSAIEQAVKVASSFGAKRAVRLNVSGAFHSSLMTTARDSLAGALREVTFSRPRVPVVSNVTAKDVTEPGEIASLLERQLTSPVMWRQSVKYMVDRGVDCFVEVGPGSVLCGLIKRSAPAGRCVPTSDLKSIETFLQEVRP